MPVGMVCVQAKGWGSGLHLMNHSFRWNPPLKHGGGDCNMHYCCCCCLFFWWHICILSHAGHTLSGYNTYAGEIWTGGKLQHSRAVRRESGEAQANLHLNESFLLYNPSRTLVYHFHTVHRMGKTSTIPVCSKEKLSHTITEHLEWRWWWDPVLLF